MMKRTFLTIFLDYFTQFSLSWKFDIFHRRNFIPTLDHRVQGFETPFSAAKKKVFLFPMIDLDEEEALYREDQWPFSLPDFSTNSVCETLIFFFFLIFFCFCSLFYPTTVPIVGRVTKNWDRFQMSITAPKSIPKSQGWGDVVQFCHPLSTRPLCQ